MEKWLTNANETLDECTGFGDENDTKQKLQAITVCTFQRCFICHFNGKKNIYFLILRIYQVAYQKVNNYLQ